jgi:tetratricopeptide (TPR) repeat protein
VAVLEARLAEEFGGNPASAIAKLKDFKTNHSAGWQITSAGSLLAQLLVATRKYDEAETVYKNLAMLDLEKQDKGRFELLAAQVSMRPGNYKKALERFDAIIDKLPKGSVERMRAQVSQCLCGAEMKLAALPKDADLKAKKAAIADAVAKLNAVLNENKTNKELRALAYNALGHCNYVADQYKEALWNFLRVDVVYHQNKDDHAQALYYLGKLFKTLGDKEHANECQAKLGSKLFAGTDYQRRMLKEKGEEEK